jgi:hypothetical protein
VTAPVQTGLTAGQMATLLVLVQAQAALRQQITQTAINAALAPFAALTAWWSADAVADAIREVLRVVQPAQLQAARVTDAYMARVLTEMTGRPVRPVGAVDITRLRRRLPQLVLEELADGRRAVPRIDLGDTFDGPTETIDEPLTSIFREDEEPDWTAAGDVYGRVADAYRYQVVAQGLPEAKAKQKALVRIAAVAETDVTLAVREQYRRTLFRRTEVTGWRRILHPELSETGPCGLCVVAADRVYKKEELKPIHDRCKCEVLPILAGVGDPGLNLNEEDLKRVYAAGGGTGGEAVSRTGRRVSPALKKVRVQLTEHGELGPVLIDGDQHYRGPAEVARTQVPDRATRARAQLDALLTSLEKLQNRADRGEDVKAPISWQRRKVTELQRELVDA